MARPFVSATEPSTPSGLFLPSLEQIRASIARDSLADFQRQAWELVEPETPFAWNWHLDELCAVLEAVARGEKKKVIINVPPGTSKSLTASVFFNAWIWASRPAARVLTASYSAHLTIRDNIRMRSIVTSPWFRRHFPDLKLSSDQNAKEKFETTAKGWRIATSVGGFATGEHPDFILIDDPLSADQARSDAERESANTWLDRTISTRGVSRGAAIVLISQRLHQEDCPGHLLAKGGWDHVMFPMRFDPKRADPRDHRTEPGALLWPGLFTEEKVRSMEIDLGPYGAAGQLQQAPSPEGGGLFKRSWFKIVDAAPAKARRCRGWDTAGTEGGGDWTAGIKLSELDGAIYVEDEVRGQWGPAGVDGTIKTTAELDGKACMQREEKEGGASGKAVITARAKLLAGFDYAGVEIGGDKVTRAKPFRAQCEAGNVYLVRGAWNEGYLQELENFPVGKNDDRVDGSSAAYNALVAERPRGDGRATW